MVTLWDVCASLFQANIVLSYGSIKAVQAYLEEDMGRLSPEIQDYAVDCIFQMRFIFSFVQYPHTHFFAFIREAFWDFFYGK